MKNIQTLDESKKGLDVYETPYTIQTNKDRTEFYYSEVGILVSAKHIPKIYGDREYLTKEYLNPLYWLPKAGKYVVDVQYDYRSGDHLNNFSWFDSPTGTYGQELIFDDFDSAIQGMFDFLDSEIKINDFHGRPVIQKNPTTVRESALYQSLHHYATYKKHREDKEPDLYESIIVNSKHKQTYLEYCDIYENRRKAEFKYRDKLNRKFESTFNVPIRKVVHHFRFSLHSFCETKGIELNEAKQLKDFRIIQKVAEYYS